MDENQEHKPSYSCIHSQIFLDSKSKIKNTKKKEMEYKNDQSPTHQHQNPILHLKEHREYRNFWYLVD